jgi:GTPase SAR1 family protein
MEKVQDIVLIGNESVGKTSISLQLEKGIFR